MSPPYRKERVYFLYGSQTGNSEQAALDLANQAATELNSDRLEQLTGKKTDISIEPVHMQLDDFIEIQQCQWTRLIVIVVSSYGVGQASLGSWRFRELCDAWLAMNQQNNSYLLQGVHYALCGLGDSKYTTFFRNPTIIDQGLASAGATRIGPLGKADASGTGEQLQSKVIDDWIAGIWPHLAKVLVEVSPSDEQLQHMQQETIEICRKINPDFVVPASSSKASWRIDAIVVVAAVIGAIVAVFVYFLIMNDSSNA